ncbi:hypothetical protein E2C01_084903 [Portunus trituberculatus]|uniref:Uncharacterized protein n=1 Tax=Portunus trituberculatus TaxID=210409 RepID=A0A5B7J5C9_PORTR|nr:hypothetical protein [Portunus trituberculatus]
MVVSNAISFLGSLVSVNNIQLHFESKRLPGLLSNARYEAEHVVETRCSGLVTAGLFGWINTSGLGELAD